MGAGASASAKIDSFKSGFISDSIEYAEKQCSANSKFRECFIEFVKNGQWMKSLVMYEGDVEVEDNCSLWERFGYTCPEQPPNNPISSLKSAASFISSRTEVSETSSTHIVSGKYAPSMHQTNSAVPGWTVGDGLTDIRSILLVALFHLFYASDEYKKMQFSSLSMGSSSSDNGETLNSEPCIDRTSHRLRDLMHAAASALDKDHLESYLSQETPTLLDDFRNAINNLPVRVNIMDVDSYSHETKCIFESSGKFIGKLSMSLSIRSGKSFKEFASGKSTAFGTKGSSKNGSTLHGALEHQGFTAAQREMLNEALAARSGLKLAVRAGADQCVLRALKPVPDSAGEVKRMISVEALEKVTFNANVGKHNQARVFQQMEDLLLILPVLIKRDE
mmetsp:Transcript_37878/g.75496  ORF Transcript_37878/g.75496 Transcript_37878/m.75496 type:complete len:391 (+) Transcript_37878:101-1273(+)